MAIHAAVTSLILPRPGARFAFGPDDKERFRIYMRMMENFSGCRVLAYCVMCNHFHLLQRFTRWHNSRVKRCGNLWEETFKSVVVEDGLASKTIAAYVWRYSKTNYRYF